MLLAPHAHRKSFSVHVLLAPMAAYGASPYAGGILIVCFGFTVAGASAMQACAHRGRGNPRLAALLTSVLLFVYGRGISGRAFLEWGQGKKLRGFIHSGAFFPLKAGPGHCAPSAKSRGRGR